MAENHSAIHPVPCRFYFSLLGEIGREHPQHAGTPVSAWQNANVIFAFSCGEKTALCPLRLMCKRYRIAIAFHHVAKKGRRLPCALSFWEL